MPVPKYVEDPFFKIIMELPWEVRLVAKLPQEKELEKRTIYLEKCEGELRYIVFSAGQKKAATGKLSFPLKGNLTQESLNKNKFEILEMLSSEGVIQTLYQKIISEQDINVVDEDGMTAFTRLIHAFKDIAHAPLLIEEVKSWIKEMLDTMRHQNGVQYYPKPNKLNSPPLHLAITRGCFLIFPELCHKIFQAFPEKIALTDAEGRNILHLAIISVFEQNNSIYYCKLLNFFDKVSAISLFKKMLIQRDVYGCTPLEIAFINSKNKVTGSRLPDVLKILKSKKWIDEEINQCINAAKENVQRNAQKIALICADVNQNVLIKKLSNYIRILNEDSPDLKESKESTEARLIVLDNPIDEEGICLGLTCLWAHFVSLEKEEIFIAIKSAIASFDGTKEGLKKQVLQQNLWVIGGSTNPPSW